MRVAFRVLGFSTSGGAPAMICRARLAANTTYANWLSGAFVRTLISVFTPNVSPKRCKKLFHAILAPRLGAAHSSHNRLYFTDGLFDVFVHDTKIVILSKFRDF